MGDDPRSDIDQEPTDTEEVKGEIFLTTIGSPVGGYSLWEFHGTAWVLKKDQSKEGYGPPPPPSVPGRFSGQLRTLMSVPLKPGGAD